MSQEWIIKGVVVLVGCFFLSIGVWSLFDCWRALQTGEIRVAHKKRSRRSYFREVDSTSFWFYLGCQAVMAVVFLIMGGMMAAIFLFLLKS